MKFSLCFFGSSQRSLSPEMQCLNQQLALLKRLYRDIVGWQWSLSDVQSFIRFTPEDMNGTSFQGQLFQLVTLRRKVMQFHELNESALAQFHSIYFGSNSVPDYEALITGQNAPNGNNAMAMIHELYELFFVDQSNLLGLIPSPGYTQLNTQYNCFVRRLETEGVNAGWSFFVSDAIGFTKEILGDVLDTSTVAWFAMQYFYEINPETKIKVMNFIADQYHNLDKLTQKEATTFFIKKAYVDDIDPDSPHIYDAVIKTKIIKTLMTKDLDTLDINVEVKKQLIILIINNFDELSEDDKSQALQLIVPNYPLLDLSNETHAYDILAIVDSRLRIEALINNNSSALKQCSNTTQQEARKICDSFERARANTTRIAPQ